MSRKTMENRSILKLAIGILILLIAAYANHFENDFHFDDFHTIVNNVHIRNISNIPQFFTDPTMFSVDPDHHGLRPLVTTTLAIDYWLGGGQMILFYFHLSTFLWFIALGLVMYFVYIKLLKLSFQHIWIPYISLFAVAWFMLHTANAETINYIISRSDVLSTFFITASFAVYILYPERRKWYLYVVLAIIGVFAKETVLVLIIVLFFYVLFFEKQLSIGDLFKMKNFGTILRVIGGLLPVFLAVAAVQLYTLSKIDSIPGITNPPGYYWLTQCYVWLHYFVSFFFPVNLSADTDWTVITNVSDIRILAGVSFVVFLVIAIFKTSRRKETKPVAFGLIWFAAALLPTSVAPFAEVTNDHRMFFPFIGLALSVVTFFGLKLIKVEQKIVGNQNWRISILSLMLLILVLNAFGVHQRNKIWRDEESLWYDVTIKSPKNGRGLMNYGLSQMAKGNFRTALEYYEKALPMLPSYSYLYINIGIVKGALGLHKEAEENFKMAIFLAPEAFDSYVYYARYLKDNKRLKEARLMSEKSLALNPQSLMNLNILMEVYHELGLWLELEQTASHALALAPNDSTALNYLSIAKRKEPATQSSGTNSQSKNTPEDMLNLSLAFYKSGMYEKCIEACLQAIKLKPDYADAYSNISAAYNMLKKWDDAEAAARKALAINPDHPMAKGNLRWAINKTQQ
jgi:tetratricopeptide (TPR) repeat protein